MSMDKVIDNLWVGDLPSALDTETLRAHNIRSVLTAMRGRISIHETFHRFQINVDDTSDADILTHLVSAVSFIEGELEKGWGVLVHCHAGMSRSASIVAAYLMYSQNIDVNAALETIRNVRPNVQPNPGFLEQLEIFRTASFKVSRRNKATRMFYLERVMQEVLNGDGSVDSGMFARFPRTPTDSAPPTPGGPRRRIRCKMCRQELATREHMLDHGQLGPATPAYTPAASRRPSHSAAGALGPLSPFNPLAPVSPAGSRRPSAVLERPALSPPGSRRGSTHDPVVRSRLGSNADTRPLRSSLLALDGAAALGKEMSNSLNLDESALEEDEEEEEEEEDAETVPNGKSAGGAEKGEMKQGLNGERVNGDDTQVARKPSISLAGHPALASSPSHISPTGGALQRAPSLSQATSPLAHGSDLAAQLYANPKLAALRQGPALSMSPLATAASGSGSGSSASGSGNPYFRAAASPPILANPKCSGYFVEPMKWMESFLEEGQMAGKIVCPNRKCGAKLGNYDWAGVCCSCHQWVVPGFCIHRSKVDEVV